MGAVKWTLDDYKIVNFVAIGNGLWLGFLLWLILGVWLEWAGFIACWIGATIFSWLVAVNRQYKVIEMREDVDSEDW